MTYAQFVGLLRSALHYLYDPVQLRRSALVPWLGLGGAFDQAAALQQALIAAIRALKPAAEESPQSRAWRVYDTLNLQYVRQLPREAVATQLGISERQMRREQRLAIEVLAQTLWPSPTPATTPAEAMPGAATDRERTDPGKALSAELGWLTSPAAEPSATLRQVLDNVRELAQPLAARFGVPLQVHLPDPLGDFLVPQLALRSILVTVLTVAIPRAQPGAVAIAAEGHVAGVALSVTCDDPAATDAPLAVKEAASLAMAQELAAYYAAQLSIEPPGTASFAVTLLLAPPEQWTLLVVDDNADWIALVQRYLADTRYQVVGCRSPEEASRLAERLQPSAILLDVMMQKVDGWQVLSEMRHEPNTSQIPVMICTILPVEGMALSLGASAYLQKPVGQQQLLAALEQLTHR